MGLKYRDKLLYCIQFVAVFSLRLDVFTTTAMSMITATTWVPRGFAAPFPTKYEFDDDEYERISKLAKLQLDDAKEDLEEAQEETKKKKDNTSLEGGGVNIQDQEWVPEDSDPRMRC